MFDEGFVIITAETISELIKLICKTFKFLRSENLMLHITLNIFVFCMFIRQNKHFNNITSETNGHGSIFYDILWT